LGRRAPAARRARRRLGNQAAQPAAGRAVLDAALPAIAFLIGVDVGLDVVRIEIGKLVYVGARGERLLLLAELDDVVGQDVAAFATFHVRRHGAALAGADRVAVRMGFRRALRVAAGVGVVAWAERLGVSSARLGRRLLRAKDAAVGHDVSFGVRFQCGTRLAEEQ